MAKRRDSSPPRSGGRSTGLPPDLDLAALEAAMRSIALDPSSISPALLKALQEELGEDDDEDEVEGDEELVAELARRLGWHEPDGSGPFRFGEEDEDEGDEEEEEEDEDEDEGENTDKGRSATWGTTENGEEAGPALLFSSMLVRYVALLTEHDLLQGPSEDAPVAIREAWRAIEAVRRMEGAEVSEAFRNGVLSMAFDVVKVGQAVPTLSAADRQTLDEVEALLRPHLEEAQASEAAETALWPDLLNETHVCELAKLLPDAGRPDGRELTPEVVGAWIDEKLPHLRGEDQETLSEELLCYRLGELTTRQGTFSLRAVVVPDGEEDHEVTIVAVGEARTQTLMQAIVGGELGAAADPRDTMRLGAALIQGLSNFEVDIEGLVLKPPFARLAQPFGTLQVGVSQAPQDRSQLRAARLKAHKRNKKR